MRWAGATLLVACLLCTPALAQPPLTVAVLEFDVPEHAKGYADLRKGLQSMLTTDLTHIPALRLVERARLGALEKELALQRSGQIDPATASKLGKLIGASHLLAGSLTLAGGKMRLDARLFGVEKGEVLLAAEVTGPEEDFWDLEKALIKKVVKALAVRPTSRQRAAMTRVHTADLAAFRSFSQGIALFDAQKYRQATEALKSAVARDAEFQLAQLTLATYERLIAELKAKAAGIEVARVEMERAEQQQSASELGQVIARLMEVAQSKGAAKRMRRLTALYLLAAAYWGAAIGPHWQAMIRSEDGFARRRLAARFCQAYYTAALPHFPEVPLLIDGDFVGHLPRALATFDADLAKATKRLRRGSKGGQKERIEALLRNLKGPDEDQRQCLELDYRSQVQQMARHYALGLKLLPKSKSAKEDSLNAKTRRNGRYGPPSYWWRGRFALRVARALRRVLEVGESTRLFAKVSEALEDPKALRRVAHEIASNKRIAGLLAEHPEAPHLREALLLSDDPGHAARGARGLVGPKLGQGWKHRLNAARKLPRREGVRFIDVGAHRVFMFSTSGYLSSGRRSDLRQTESLRYAAGRGGHGLKTNVLIVDGLRRDEVDLGFELRYGYPRDFEAAGDVLSVARGLDLRRRPVAGVLFGIRDLDRWAQREIRGRLQEGRAESRAYGVLVSGEKVALVRLTRKATRGGGQNRRPWRSEVLEAFPLEPSEGETLKVRVRVGAKKTTAQIGAQRLEFETPSERRGFYGVTFMGRGYVGLGDLKAR